MTSGSRLRRLACSNTISKLISTFRQKNRGNPVVRKKIGIVGFPHSDGQIREGTEYGPSALRNAGIHMKLKELGHEVSDHGDVVEVKNNEEITPDDPFPLVNGICEVKKPRNCGMANKKLSEGVQRVLKLDQSVLILGGDHSMAIGSIHGHAQVKKPVVVWVDAHADINMPHTSQSGNIHGMPLSFVVKELSKKNFPGMVPGFEWCEPCIDIKDIVYIGLRDVDIPERKIIREHNMHYYSMQEIDHMTISAVMENALRNVDPDGKRPIHLSFDVDSMDPQYTPSTGTPVKGGLTLRETFYIAEAIAKTGRLSVLDIAEVNASADLFTQAQRETTINTTNDVISKFYDETSNRPFRTQYRHGSYRQDTLEPQSKRWFDTHDGIIV